MTREIARRIVRLHARREHSGAEAADRPQTDDIHADLACLGLPVRAPPIAPVRPDDEGVARE